MPGTSGVSGTGGTDYGNTVFTDKQTKELTSQDFLELMVAQLRNQDFMNPVDDTQFLSQMAQFTTMQQSQEMAELTKQNYVRSLVGQNVTAARFKVSGELESVTGIIEKVSLVDNDFLIYIGDKTFSLDQIMTLNVAGTVGEGETKPEEGPDYAQGNFLLSLIGKPVTVRGEEKDEKISGVVKGVSMDGLKFSVDGEWYTMDDLLSIDVAEEGPEGGDKTEGGEESS